jgi:hypothetical protein
MAADKTQCSAWERVVMGSQDIMNHEVENQVGLLLGDICRNIFQSSERVLAYLNVSTACCQNGASTGDLLVV